jgi:hypothetical protein
MQAWTFRKRIAAALVAGIGAAAFASPIIDSAVIKLRIFNDDADSIITTSNIWPSLISIKDEKVDGGGPGGYANRHNYGLSDNGGITPAVFLNGDSFLHSATVGITGTANAEGGLRVSPWWSKDVDGTFMINGGSGEVAVFGGRLPFYSFTGTHGVTYTKGTKVRMGMVYDPNGLSSLDPATIQYIYTDSSGTYMSPNLAFDEGNGGEGYGTWGMLDDARVGGYFQVPIQDGNPDNWGQITFEDIHYTPEPTSLGLLLLGGLAAFRRQH